MSEYASVTELREYLPQASTGVSADALLLRILKSASRLIDRYTKRRENYFQQAGTASDLTFYGDGTNYMEVGHYIETIDADDVSLPDGYESFEFTAKVNDETGYLIRTYSGVFYPRWTNNYGRYLPITTSGGFDVGVPVTVSAKWGFILVPDDIKEACLQIAVRHFRGKDEAFSGVIGGINTDGNIIERDLPASAKSILDRWKPEGFVFA